MAEKTGDAARDTTGVDSIGLIGVQASMLEEAIGVISGAVVLERTKYDDGRRLKNRLTPEIPGRRIE